MIQKIVILQNNEFNIDYFNKIVIDLESIGVKVEDEDQAIMLLNLLPKVYKSFRDTIKYGHFDI